VAVALSCLLLAQGAWAGLGGDLASVQSDTQALGASGASTAIAGATLYTLSLTNGLKVRQYVDAAGFVFAVGWEGPVLPDFERLLGTHYAAYAEALHKQRRGVNVQGANLVIESGGMMRAFAGRAYLIDKLPPSLTAQDIR
jgi:hypothetical protein